MNAFRPVPRTGVIYVTSEAARLGYGADGAGWSNLGQGQPETGPLPGAPPRVTDLLIDPTDQDYAPVPGLWELREAVANLYNRLYRRGLPSQYSAENVAISGGGRAGGSTRFETPTSKASPRRGSQGGHATPGGRSPVSCRAPPPLIR